MLDGPKRSLRRASGYFIPTTEKFISLLIKNKRKTPGKIKIIAEDIPLTPLSTIYIVSQELGKVNSNSQGFPENLPEPCNKNSYNLY